MLDSAGVYIRHFDPERIERFRSDRRYDYSVGEAPSSGWWDWLAEFLRKLFDNGPGRIPSDAWEILLMMVAVVFVMYLAFRIVKADKSWFLRKPGKKLVMPGSYELADNISETDFEGLLHEALREGNHRLAVRFLYLRLLQSLDMKGLVKWEKFKTNAEYYLELKDKNLKKDFRDASRWYEYIWYGDFQIDDQAYVSAERVFTALDQRIGGRG